MVYDALAPIYDRMMSHVDYLAWVELIDRIVHKYSLRPSPSIVEFGSGTGVLAAMLNRRGFNHIGSDLSFSMCRKARERNVRVVCADARAVPVKQKFNLAIFLYDGINYITSLKEYALLFSQVSQCLVPDGFFLFDITTEANSLSHFSSYLEFEDWGDFAYVRRSYYNKEQIEQHNDITIFRQINERSSAYEKVVERHCQKVFSAATIAEAVPENLFTIQGIWDGFSFRNYRPHSERIHFLLKKRSA